MDTLSYTFPVFSPRPLWHTSLWGVLLVATLLPWTVHGQSTPPIQPQSSSLQESGSTFWVDIQVGSEQAPVENLFGLSLTMTYDTSRVEVLNDEPGPFLGNDVVYSANVDAAAGEVGIGVSRKSGAGGVEGTGVVARVEVRVKTEVPEGDTLTFRFSDVSATDPEETPIALDARSRGVTIGTAVPVQSAVQGLSGDSGKAIAPGDTVAVDVTVGSDAIPVSDLFGTSFTWTYEPENVTILSDTAGAFLGNDLVYGSNVEPSVGEVGIGVSRKAGAGGVDGAGSVARILARVNSDVAEGTMIAFGVENAQARNPADSSIALAPLDGGFTANAVPAPPLELSGAATGPNVSLDWTAPDVPDLERYRVYRSTAPIDSTADPSTLTPLDSVAADTTSFVDSTATLGTPYYYRLTAVDSLGSESGFSDEAHVESSIAIVARPDTARVRTGSSRTLNVLANDAAAGELVPTSVSVDMRPSNGTTAVHEDGTITYTHDGSDALTDSFTYSVADREGRRSEPATVRLYGVNLQVETGPATRGSPVSVEVEVEGNFAPQGALYVREGGGTGYQEVLLEGAGEQSNRLTGEIPSDVVTPRGIDYYVVLFDGSDTLTVPTGGEAQARQRPRHLPVTVANLEAQVQPEPETYQMMTVSAVPQGEEGIKGTLAENYGDYNRSEWRVLRWDPTEGEDGAYREYPSIDSLGAGEGFWLITAAGDGLSLDSARTVDGSAPRRISLDAGWNQVGSPFGYSVPWDTIRSASGLDPSEIDGPVVYEDGGYQYRDSVRSALEPWTAAFVRVPEATTLVIPPVGTSDQVEGQVRSENEEATPPRQRTKKAYALWVEAQPKTGDAHHVRLGLRSAAQAGRGRLDVAQPPPIGQPVLLSVWETVHGKKVPHARSVKPPAEEGQTWRLALSNRSDQAREVRLRLREKGSLPSGQQRYLLDMGEEQRVASGTRLELEKGETKALKVIVGTEAFAKTENQGVALDAFENELRSNYPNPFDGKTTIEYVLSEEQEVTVDVYNVLGQRVRTLEHGVREAGPHTVQWEGDTRYGTPVGSGVYFYRITAEGFTETRKMMLVR